MSINLLTFRAFPSNWLTHRHSQLNMWIIESSHVEESWKWMIKNAKRKKSCVLMHEKSNHFNPFQTFSMSKISLLSASEMYTSINKREPWKCISMSPFSFSTRFFHVICLHLHTQNWREEPSNKYSPLSIFEQRVEIARHRNIEKWWEETCCEEGKEMEYLQQHQTFQC